MSTMTIKADGIMTDLIHEAEQADGYGSTFLHADGSVTVICQDYEQAWEYNPREDDTIACLVSMSRDYTALDDGDSEIEEMREAFEALGSWTSRSDLTDHWTFEMEDWCGIPTPFLSIKMVGGYTRTYYLDDEIEARVAASYFLGHNAEQAMDHYLATERVDIAAYLHSWQVNGSSQSDWREGYAYVTVGAMLRAGFGPADARLRAKEVLDSELNVYGLYFAGEMFYSTTIHPAGEDYAIADSGGYYTGETLGYVESCYGHLGYPTIRAIAEDQSSSPVIEQLR